MWKVDSSDHGALAVVHIWPEVTAVESVMNCVFPAHVLMQRRISVGFSLVPYVQRFLQILWIISSHGLLMVKSLNSLWVCVEKRSQTVGSQFFRQRWTRLLVKTSFVAPISLKRGKIREADEVFALFSVEYTSKRKLSHILLQKWKWKWGFELLVALKVIIKVIHHLGPWMSAS